MACQNCGHDSWVTIGSKQYCTNCGSLGTPNAIVGGVKAVAGPAEAAPRTVVTPSRQVIAPKPVAAQSVHSSTLAAGGVLDLRQPKPQATMPRPTRPENILVVAPQPMAQPKPAPAPAPQPRPTPQPKAQPSLREVAAQLSSPAEQVQAINNRSLQKPLSIGAAALAVIILGGYIWINNFNNLSIRTASQRAGIVASLPQYVPSNYKLDGPISYGTGFVSFNLRANNNQNIAIIQRQSDWDSASLLELYVTPKDKNYTAVESQGLKIFLYGDGSATWVNRGLQYVVEANSALSREQIVKLAESL